MKPKIIPWIIGILLLVNLTLAVDTNLTINYASTGNTPQMNGYSRGQTFNQTDSSNTYMTAVQLYIISVAGTPGDFNVRITPTDPTTGKPDPSTTLGQISIPTANISGGWYNFTFTLPISLSPNVNYAVVEEAGGTIEPTDKYVLQASSSSVYPNGKAAYCVSADTNTTSAWSLETNSDMRMVLWFTSSPSATIDFQGDTPTNNTNQFYTNPNITINTTTTFIDGTIDTSHFLFNASGTLLQQNNNTGGNGNYTSTFTNLPIGTYLFNATATNSTNTTNSETRTINIYEIIPGNITNPSNNTGITTQYTNITYQAATTNPSGIGITFPSYTIDILNPSQSLNLTINTTPSTSEYWNVFASGLEPEEYWIKITSTDSQGHNNSIAHNITINYNADINLTFRNAVNGSIITNGSFNITNLNTSILRTINTTTGSEIIGITKGDNYNLTMNFPGFAITSQTYQTDNTTHQAQNISLYTNNSINIYIYDENTGFLIAENITITFSGLSEFTNYTNNGTFYIDQLLDGNWTIKFEGSNYTLKQYEAIVGSRSHQNLNAYLTSNSQTTIFTIIDYDSSQIIEGANMIQQRLINSTWTTINTKNSDITGRIEITYTPNIKYQFIVSSTNYETSTFTLDPILFSTYNVRLHKTTTLTPPTTPSGTGISIIYYNTTFINEANNTFTWIINSPTGTLTTYNLSIDYPGGNSTYDSGANLYGETFTNTFYITGANITDQVIISYCYQTITSYNNCIIKNYLVIGAFGNNTFISNRDTTFGMGILERVIIGTIIILFISGVFFNWIGPLPGLVIAMLLMGVFVYIGFFSKWMIIPTALIGVLILIRGDKYG